MQACKMKHPGTSTVTKPAVTSRYYDPDKGEYAESVVSPEETVTIQHPAGAKFGNFVIGAEITVPPHMQKSLYSKGFRFCDPKDEQRFLREQAASEKAAVTAAAATTTSTEGGN